MFVYQVADLKIIERLLEHSALDMAISKPSGRLCSVSDATKKPTFERRLWMIHDSSYEYAFLGHRISELRLARKEHFDMINDVWTVPPEISKMGNAIRRPIPKHIKPMLERLMNIYDGYLFPGSSLNAPLTISAANKYIRRIRDTLPFATWRTHDFRRSISTICSELGAAPHVVEKMLGHDLGGILAVYNKHDWLSEQKDAYENFAETLFRQVKVELNANS